METLVVHGSNRKSVITVGERHSHAGAYTPHEKAFVVTDTEVRRLYPAFFRTCEPVVIGTGERIKTLDTVALIYEKLLEKEADRSVFLIGVGGGVVCDVVGFAAATYLRGVRFGFVPTTLLSQVDAAVGGKNGVNFKGFKNKIGAITQPDFVWCDPSFFRTLPEREIRSGLAEVVKQAFIADINLVEYIENNVQDILSLKSAAMERLVLDCLRIKAGVVSRDEKEQGERRILNFGHTVGHAVEQRSGLAHGEAVSVGMAAAAALSVRLGLLSTDKLTRILKLLRRLHLPVSLPAPADEIIAALGQDKKREGEALHFVLLNDLGRAVVREINLTELRVLLLEIFKETL
ncbi:MAG: 3-dehydroquinate synthase [Prevotellaceae bacterium]|nr:3-dehydroquinate synthase [Prevotellaceae bacterium]